MELGSRKRQFVLGGALALVLVVFVAWRLIAGPGGPRVDRQTRRHADEIRAQVMEPTEPAPPDPSLPAPTTDAGTAPTPVKGGSRPPP